MEHLYETPWLKVLTNNHLWKSLIHFVAVKLRISNNYGSVYTRNLLVYILRTGCYQNGGKKRDFSPAGSTQILRGRDPNKAMRTQARLLLVYWSQIDCGYSSSASKVEAFFMNISCTLPTMTAHNFHDETSLMTWRSGDNSIHSLYDSM